MSRLARLVMAGMLVFLSAADASKMTISFDQDAVGKPPVRFMLARTGPGAEGTWIVVNVKDFS
jgi:hypothetical protein